jgi:fructose-1-phosphate kinase PfkB-like protein
VDKLYSLTLASAVGCECCILTGNVDTGEIPSSFYGRLCEDLVTFGVPVIADLHGPELDEIVESAAVALLKVSDQDLRDDGVVPDERFLAAAVTDLAARARHDLVVTRGPDRPAAMRLGGEWFRVSAPRLMAVDWRGAGDAMTGAMAVAKIRGGAGVDIARFGAAAGAASVARRGIASLDADLVDAIVPHVVVEPVDGPETAVAG